MTETPKAGTKAAAKTTTERTLALRVADLPGRGHVPFHLTPDAEARQDIAEQLRIVRIRKLDFRGDVQPQGSQDWALTAKLGATVVQECVVTAEPVTTRIDVDVTRIFVRHMDDPTEAESEMPEDDTREPLRAVIDLGDVMAEALALELPDYPRASEASLDDVEGLSREPLEDERPNPFAALEALKSNMERDEPKE